MMLNEIAIRRNVRALLATFILSFEVFGVPAQAVEPEVAEVRFSPDITVRLDGQSVVAVTAHDEDAVVESSVAGVSLLDIGTIPSAADVDGYFLFSNDEPPNQRQLLSFDITVRLSNGIIAEPRDVVLFDGATFSTLFDGGMHGISNGVNVDAVSLVGSLLYLSFDTAVELGNFVAEDEDVVIFSLISNEFARAFDGSSVGLSPALDVNGFHFPAAGTLHLSVDGSGEVGGVQFADEDVLEYRPGIGAWRLVYDGSLEEAAMSTVDVDALHTTFVTPPRAGDLNNDGSVDRRDLAVVLAERNLSVPPGDPYADLDGDGRITGLDARKLVLLCDNPGCA